MQDRIVIRMEDLLALQSFSDAIQFNSQLFVFFTSN